MFYLLKNIYLLIISPLPIILFLILIGIKHIYSKKNKSGFLLILMSLIIYSCSCNFLINPLMLSLENDFPSLSQEKIKNSNIYILLGGGILSNTKIGSTPTMHAYPRILKTIELYKKSPKPVYISGGISIGNKESESFIYKNLLVKSGVNEENIFIEEKSKTTAENSKYIKEIMKSKNIKSGILITSAYHMPRSMAIFKDKNFIFYPANAGYLGNFSNQKLLNYIPSFKNLFYLNIILHEYIGRVYYYIKY